MLPKRPSLSLTWDRLLLDLTCQQNFQTQYQPITAQNQVHRVCLKMLGTDSSSEQ